MKKAKLKDLAEKFLNETYNATIIDTSKDEDSLSVTFKDMNKRTNANDLMQALGVVDFVYWLESKKEES